MAFRRNMSTTTATLFSRKLQPFYTPIFHAKNDRKEFAAPSLCPTQPPLSTLLAFGLCNKANGVGSLFRERTSFSFARSTVLGSSFYRHMSSTIGDGSDEVNEMGYVAEVVTEKTMMESVASQGTVVCEVAVAAADSFFPVAVMQHLVDAVHSISGFNWWISIALTTILVRGALTLLWMSEIKYAVKFWMMWPYLKLIFRDAKMDPEGLTKCANQLRAIRSVGGVAPILVTWGGMFFRWSISLSLFFAIDNMAEKVQSFKTGGALWFLDLTAQDSLLILPALSTLTYWLALEASNLQNEEKSMWKMFALVSALYISTWPKALFCYVIPSCLCSILLSLAFRRVEVRKFLGVPVAPTRPPKR